MEQAFDRILIAVADLEDAMAQYHALLGVEPVTRTNAQGVLDMLPKRMPTDRAAVIIVDGFTRKARKIFVPWYTKVLYFVQRMWPEFGHKGVVNSIGKFRANRNDEVSQR